MLIIHIDAFLWRSPRFSLQALRVHSAPTVRRYNSKHLDVEAAIVHSVR